MNRIKMFAMSVANLLTRWAGKPRLCYVCCVAITDMHAVVRDHHLCSECHALTRPLARRRVKERKKRRKHDYRFNPTGQM